MVTKVVDNPLFTAMLRNLRGGRTTRGQVHRASHCWQTFLILLTVLLSIATTAVSAAKKLPELTSTALKLHKTYALDPPHDVHLYDALEVFANATTEQIAKSYRRLSRMYHPDKRRQSSRQSSQSTDVPQRRRDDDRLQQIQHAYEVLSKDATRLPYHKYGLVDPNLAVFLLMGPKLTSSRGGGIPFDKLDKELLRLMGYDETILQLAVGDTTTTYSREFNLEEYRVRTIAAILVEQIRPLVEGRIDLGVYAHKVATDCDRWKRLPLGAQIIRCVGRAYRHAGTDFLQQCHSRSAFQGKRAHHIQTDISIGLRQQWRHAKHFWTAALASGRLAVTEHIWKRQQERQQKKQTQRQGPQPDLIDYYNAEKEVDSFLPYMDDDAESGESMDDLEDHKAFERASAQQTLLQVLQVEALWKVSKIDLDKTVRKACGMILSGEYFFFPSHQSSEHHPDSAWSDHQSSGWVTSSGNTLDVERAKVKAAKALEWTGKIMVDRSKDGTSWKA